MDETMELLERQLAAVQKDGHAIRWIREPSEAVQLAAVQQNGKAIEYIKDPSEAVQLAAVQECGWALQFIKKPFKDPPEAVQLVAVKQDGCAIKNIWDPSEAVQLAAIQQDRDAIRFIDDPSETVLKVMRNSQRKDIVMKFMYIRDEKRAPVGCLVYDRQPTELQYEYSIHNPQDPFDRRIARTVAQGRFQHFPKALLVKESWSTKECIMELLKVLESNDNLPKRFRKAALLTRQFMEATPTRTRTPRKPKASAPVMVQHYVDKSSTSTDELGQQLADTIAQMVKLAVGGLHDGT